MPINCSHIIGSSRIAVCYSLTASLRWLVSCPLLLLYMAATAFLNFTLSSSLLRV